jgi:hypothetical protein
MARRNSASQLVRRLLAVASLPGCPQIGGAAGRTVGGAGNLYEADTGNNRVLKYTPGP